MYDTMKKPGSRELGTTEGTFVGDDCSRLARVRSGRPAQLVAEPRRGRGQLLCMRTASSALLFTPSFR
jgi:hypothetical protein